MGHQHQGTQKSLDGSILYEEVQLTEKESGKQQVLLAQLPTSFINSLLKRIESKYEKLSVNIFLLKLSV